MFYIHRLLSVFFTYVLSYNCNGLICYKTPQWESIHPKPLATICYITISVVLNDTLLITLTMFNIAKTEIRVNPWIGWASARLLKGNILLHSLDPWFCTTCRAKKALQISLNSLVCKPFFSLRWLALIINPCGNVKIIVDIPKGTKTFVRNLWFVQRSLISCYTLWSSKSY